MELRKRGVIFTLICITLLSLLLISSTSYYSFTRNEKAQLVSVSVGSLQRMLKDVEGDMSRAAYITSFRAILSMEEVVFNTNNFLPNAQDVFKSLFLNGSYNGTQYSLMQNNTFYNWTAKAIAQAEALDFNLTFDVASVAINHSTPWTLLVQIQINVSIADTKNIAQINKSTDIVTSIDIFEFEDPLYNKFTVNEIANLINKSPYIGNFTQGADVSNLSKHMNGTYSYYVESTSAPSFLMRFEGQLQPSPYGIESMLNYQRFWDKSLTVRVNSSVIDYLYWNTTTTYRNWTIAGMPSWFRIDNGSINSTENRTTFYGVDSLLQN